MSTGIYQPEILELKSIDQQRYLQLDQIIDKNIDGNMEEFNVQLFPKFNLTQIQIEEKSLKDSKVLEAYIKEQYIKGQQQIKKEISDYERSFQEYKKKFDENQKLKLYQILKQNFKKPGISLQLDNMIGNSRQLIQKQKELKESIKGNQITENLLKDRIETFINNIIKIKEFRVQFEGCYSTLFQINLDKYYKLIHDPIDKFIKFLKDNTILIVIYNEFNKSLEKLKQKLKSEIERHHQEFQMNYQLDCQDLLTKLIQRAQKQYIITEQRFLPTVDLQNLLSQVQEMNSTQTRKLTNICDKNQKTILKLREKIVLLTDSNDLTQQELKLTIMKYYKKSECLIASNIATQKKVDLKDLRVYRHTMDIQQNILEELAKLAWLSNYSINFFCFYLMERQLYTYSDQRKPNIIIPTNIFAGYQENGFQLGVYTNLKLEYGLKTKDKIQDNFRFILAPANLLEDHWVAFCADTDKKIIYLFDSLKMGKYDLAKIDLRNRLLQYIEENPQNTQYRTQHIQTMQQSNGSDCGVFSLKFIYEVFTKNIYDVTEVNFTQNDVTKFRQQLLYLFLCIGDEKTDQYKNLDFTFLHMITEGQTSLSFNFNKIQND